MHVPVRRVAVVCSVVLVVAAVGPAAAGLHSNHLAVDAQVSADGTVVLESGFATGEAFIVVRTVSGGDPGDVVGVTPFPSPGEFRSPVDVSLDDDAWAATDGSRRLWALLYEDTNGNGEYDAGTDERLYNFGSPAGDRFTLAAGEAPAHVVVQGQGALESTDGTVTVRQVALPEDGRLVVRASEDGSPGEVVGSRALDAGTHRDVTVPLDAAFFDGQDDRFGLHAQVYVDGDPVTAGGNAVGSRFFVTKPPGATAAPDAATNGTTGPSDDPTPTDDGPAVNTPETTPTDDGPAVNTPEPTTDATATPAPERTGASASASPSPDTTSGDGPGFGVAAAVVALLTGGLLARRRAG
jgi:PGF-CTERM protein